MSAEVFVSYSRQDFEEVHCIVERLRGAGVSVYDGNCWSSFDNRDGLVSDRVRCIHQDNLGYLWFGTAKGLTRYLKRIKTPPIRITSVQTDQDYTDLQNIPPLSFWRKSYLQI